jgi:mono/diheme cytochrome c family protein
MRVSLALLVAAFFAFGVAAGGRQQEPAAPAPELATLVRTHCVTCHNDRLKTAGLSLQSLDLANVAQDARVWEKVARKLRSGEMPPSTVRNRPDPELAASVVTYLETTLDRAAAAHPDPGPGLVHRLNRAEYSNAIRDLLAVDIRPGDWLPATASTTLPRCFPPRRRFSSGTCRPRTR